jgi:single-strand DNA-binding protein
LGNDPLIRCSQAGRKIATFNVITLDPRTSRRQFHKCVVHAELTAEFVERHLRKGSLVYAEGALETRKWLQKDGTSETWTSEIAVHKVVALDWQRGNDRIFEDQPEDDMGHSPTPRSAAKYGDDTDAEPHQNSDKIDTALPWLAP